MRNGKREKTLWNSKTSGHVDNMKVIIKTGAECLGYGVSSVLAKC